MPEFDGIGGTPKKRKRPKPAEFKVNPRMKGADKLEKVPGSIGTVQKKGTRNRQRAKEVAEARLRSDSSPSSSKSDDLPKVVLTSKDNLTKGEQGFLDSIGKESKNPEGKPPSKMVAKERPKTSSSGITTNRKFPKAIPGAGAVGIVATLFLPEEASPSAGPGFEFSTVPNIVPSPVNGLASLQEMGLYTQYKQKENKKKKRPCPYPFRKAGDKSRCGGRSAWSRGPTKGYDGILRP